MSAAAIGAAIGVLVLVSAALVLVEAWTGYATVFLEEARDLAGYLEYRARAKLAVVGASIEGGALNVTVENQGSVEVSLGEGAVAVAVYTSGRVTRHDVLPYGAGLRVLYRVVGGRAYSARPGSTATLMPGESAVLAINLTLTPDPGSVVRLVVCSGEGVCCSYALPVPG
ncbi:hypothetical protein [Pyrodictium abyssi]|uniref:Uncharacterized protein n=1 Tax=Pyrodictium abyssi TaxID=54256 RepID=A0ABM8IVU4_9CREN|nr:hypothetical protein PABY_05030 [Pyrodictium abyssi]